MEAFDNAYEGIPTWDLGHPQPAVVRLWETGQIAGDVLDVGCGTGEAALFLAARGCRVVGVDFSRRAIERATAGLAAVRVAGGTPAGNTVEFLQANALELAEVGRLVESFDVALDVGLFHTLQPADRARYAEQLAACVRPGGRAFVLCWSDRNQFGLGPERIGRRHLRESFRAPWEIESIDADALETRLPGGSVHAWLATLRRL